MNRILFILLSVCFALACAGEIPGLVVQSSPFNPAGKTILVRHFQFDPAIATGVRKEAVRDFGEAISLDIQRFLKEAGFRKTLVVAPGEQVQPVQGEILIAGTIIRAQGGDPLQRRTLELFGFGASEVKATGEVTDMASSTPILAFSLTKASHYTWLDNESAVRENVRQIAREIALAVAGMR